MEIYPKSQKNISLISNIILSKASRGATLVRWMHTKGYTQIVRKEKRKKKKAKVFGFLKASELGTCGSSHAKVSKELILSQNTMRSSEGLWAIEI